MATDCLWALEQSISISKLVYSQKDVGKYSFKKFIIIIIVILLFFFYNSQQISFK